MALTIIKRALALVMLTLAVWAFLGGHRLADLAIRLQLVPAVMQHPLLGGGAFLLLTLLFGRFFCEAMCPLGILQSLANRLVHPLKGVRRVCTRLPESRAQQIVRWSVVTLVVGLLIGGFGGLAYSLEPYTIFSRAMTWLMPFPILLGAIVLLAAIGSGRIWCNWVCPVGTVLNLLSRFAPYGNRVCKGCAHCRKCFPKPEAKPAEAPQAAQPAPTKELTRRETMKGLVLAAAVEKTTDGGLAELVLPVPTSERQVAVLPPGALSPTRFNARCLGCGRCLAACPTGVLVPSVKLRSFGQPELDFSRGVCSPDCDQRCARACPAGAIVPLAELPRRDVHIARAVWKSERCLREQDGVPCTICARHCPYDAIHLVGNAVVVDDLACVGCGICEHGCAARPEPAIVVEGGDLQRIVRPIHEPELIDEMRSLLDRGFAVAVAHEGVIRRWEKGRGIKPLLGLLDAGDLKGALVVDRVIGRAAAAICIAGGVRKVHALLMSRDAVEFLRAHQIVCESELTVERILNRDKTDGCPMEAAVAGLDDPQRMVEALRQKVEAMAK